MDMGIYSDALLLPLDDVHVNHGYLHPNSRILHQFLFCSSYPLFENEVTDLYDVLRLSFVEVAFVDKLDQFLRGDCCH